MHHRLDIQPVPEKVIYINELNFLSPDLYGTDDECKRALTGKKQSEGGILPEDNVRIYVPMDLNEDYIMYRLHILETALGDSDESNESWYLSGVQQLMDQLEVYDQVWVARDLLHALQKSSGEKYHSQKGINLAMKIVGCLEAEAENSVAESYPFEIIEMIKEEFWL